MSRAPKKYHYIYKTTCKVTGKFYVGMHSSDSLDDDYLGSGKILGYSRKKYGDENHVREILEYCSSRDELKQREKEIVCDELLADPLNINLKYGGEGGGRIWNESHQNKLRQLAKISGPARLAEYRSTRTREQASIDGKKATHARMINGQPHNWVGRRHSLESKQKTSDSMVGLQVGKKNSQYGTCWVTNGHSAVKIKNDQLNEFLTNGFIRGRRVNS